jgi:hypothetical protein
MREIKDHIVEGDLPQNQLKIEVKDAPGSGGASHRYDVTGFDTANNPGAVDEGGYRASFSRLPIVFQNGPILEAGVNGITQEVLLAIVIDRLRSFQAGPYPSHANLTALYYCEQALLWLQKRTKDRLARGVEGKTLV